MGGHSRRQECTWVNGSLGKGVTDPIKGGLWGKLHRIINRVFKMQGMKKFLGIKSKREMEKMVWSAFVGR